MMVCVSILKFVFLDLLIEGFCIKFITAATRQICTGLNDKICNWVIEDVNLLYNKIFVFTILMFISFLQKSFFSHPQRPAICFPFFFILIKEKSTI